MTHLERLINKFCPNGVDYKTLGEVSVDMYRGSGIKREQITDSGTPCVRYGEIYTTYNIWFKTCMSYTDAATATSKKYFEYGDVLFAITGESIEEIAKSCVYVGNEKCLAGGDIVVMKHRQDPKYMSYVLSTTDAQAQKSKGKVKSKVVHSSIPALKAIAIPIPPLPIQQEIVRILDTFTALETELETELEARKKQYEYYRDELLTFSDDVPAVPLGQIFQMKAGKFIQAIDISEVKDDEYAFPCYGGNGLRGFVKNYNQDAANVLIGRQGALCGNIRRVSSKYYATEHAVVVTAKKTVNIDWAFYMLTSMNLNQYKSKSAQPGLSVEKIEQLKIHLPPLAEQERVAAILDRFDALVNDITQGLPAEIAARRKQYEYYRDKLLTFERKDAAV